MELVPCIDRGNGTGSLFTTEVPLQKEVSKNMARESASVGPIFPSSETFVLGNRRRSYSNIKKSVTVLARRNAALTDRNAPVAATQNMKMF